MKLQYIKGVVTEVKAVDGGNEFTVIASTEATDREGEIIKVDGWELDNYMLNPVILWAHDISSLPIGKAVEVKKDTEAGQLVVRGMFASKEANPIAEQVRLLYNEGVQTTVSVGFIPTEREGNVITKAELLELSFVPVPANPEAVAIRKRLNLDKSLFEDEKIINRRAYNPARLKQLIMDKKKELPPMGEPADETPATETPAEGGDTSALEGELTVVQNDIATAIEQIVIDAVPELEVASQKQLEGEAVITDLVASCNERVTKQLEMLADAVVTTVGDATDASAVEEDVRMDVEDSANAIIDEVSTEIETVATDIVETVDEATRAKAEEDVAPIIADMETKIEEEVLSILGDAVPTLTEAVIADASSEEDVPADGEGEA